MNLKQMQYILEIQRCGGMHAASQKLYISQPALSQHLQRAEEELGIRIFDRSGKGLHATYVGRAALASFEKILFEYSQLEKFIQESDQIMHGSLRIGIPPVRAMQFMPVLLPEFRKRYPGIRIELHELTSSEMPKLLRSGELDLGLFVVEEYAKGLEFIPVMEDDLFLALQPGSEADVICRRCEESGNGIDIRLLKNQPIILPRPNSHIRDCADKLYAKYGLQPSIVLEATTFELAFALAATGIGMTIVSRLFLHFSDSRYRANTYSLAHEVDGYKLGIICNPAHYRSEVMETFIDFTKDAVEKLPIRLL